MLIVYLFINNVDCLFVYKQCWLFISNGLPTKVLYASRLSIYDLLTNLCFLWLSDCSTEQEKTIFFLVERFLEWAGLFYGFLVFWQSFELGGLVLIKFTRTNGKNLIQFLPELCVPGSRPLYLRELWLKLCWCDSGWWYGGATWLVRNLATSWRHLH